MKTFLKVFGVIVLLIVIVGIVLPNQIDVRRSIEINAPLESIHEYANDLEKWPLWSPWIAEDPTIEITLGEIHQGVGATQSWKAASGNGKITLTASSLEQGIVYDMSFAGDSTLYQAGLSYESQGDTIVVTWFMTGEMKPIVIGNYFALLMDSLVGDSFAQGLEKLKKLAENSEG